jgi:hypothetical protein
MAMASDRPEGPEGTGIAEVLAKHTEIQEVCRYCYAPPRLARSRPHH